MPTKSVKTVLDTETGEVFLHQEYPNEEGIIFNSKRKFFKKHISGPKPKFKSSSSLGHWYKLTDYIEYNTNRLVRRRRHLDGGRYWYEYAPLTHENLQLILDISRAQLYRFLKECHHLGVMRYTKDAFYMSPVYVLNGQGVSVELYLIFEGDKIFEKHLTKTDKRKIRQYLKASIS